MEHEKLRVKLTSEANRDILSIAEQIGQHDTQAAIRFLDSVNKTAELLSINPRMGTVIGKRESRELRCRSVAKYPIYVMFYYQDDGTLVVFRVMHGNRDIDSIFKDD